MTPPCSDGLDRDPRPSPDEAVRSTPSTTRRRWLVAVGGLLTAGCSIGLGGAASAGDTTPDESDGEPEDTRDQGRLTPICHRVADGEELSNGDTVCDVNGDGHYRDLDASGDVNSRDLNVFLSNQHRDPWDSRPDLFDFNGDGNVGQPDVVDLFREL